MLETFKGTLPPEVAFSSEALRGHLQAVSGINQEDLFTRLLRRSVDARGRSIKVNIEVLYASKDAQVPAAISYDKDKLPFVGNGQQVIVVGAGPAGLFAALTLIELGIKPIIIERGKDVRARRRDLAAINKEHVVNPESNYCFGEGGAGTYSDGKLYTRSTKRGDIKRTLEILVNHGATTDILADAHPHIGTNKLPVLIAEIRQTIIDHGGEILFNAKVKSLLIKNRQCLGVELADQSKVEGSGVILATGHSADDVFHMLHRQDVLLEAKPFAMGVRIEHPQEVIDEIQYHCTNRKERLLPAASYSLVQQVAYQGKEAGVFSFCMCPGGFIVPSATGAESLVVNGMSPSKRDGQFANSGMVVSVGPEDWLAYADNGALAGLYFQRAIERKCWASGGQTQTAPAQRVTDFVKRKPSQSLPQTSYQPGLVTCNVDEYLPAFIAERLRTALPSFGKKMNGYYSSEGQLIGLESRTSSPVRIPRDRETCEHPQISGLYPCGEGAGYAGGIMSAAMDGERCARALVAKLHVNTLSLP